MTEPLTGRFSAITAQLRATAAAAPASHERTELGRFKRREAKEQDNAATKAEVENSAVFKILHDTSLDPKERAEKIADLLLFNEEDLEANEKAIAENQDMVAQLLKDFTEHNKSSIALTRDNPLSELRGGIREVFEEYNQLVLGRDDLKHKLEVIDEIIKKHGGAEGLIKALLNAKSKEGEKQALDEAISAGTRSVSAIDGKVRELDTKSLGLRRAIEEGEKDSFLFFKREKKRQVAEQKAERAQVEEELTMKRRDLTDATASLSGKTQALQNFLSTEDYQMHEKILSILDIGTADFKEKLKSLSEITLSYIDNTSNTLEGVRAQLEKLLGRVTGVHTVTQNTVENVSILLEAQERAQRQNAVKMKELEGNEETTGVAGMKREKKLRALHQHVSSVERTTQSTAAIAGELGKVQVTLTNFKDQMQEGLSDAIEQQMLAVSSAAMTGNATLMRIESLATFVQGLMTKGQYMREAELFLGDMAKEMERSLTGRLAKNEGIRSVADILGEMTSAMEEKNDVVLQIAGDRKDLIDRLIAQTRKLGDTNEAALAIESVINKNIYLKDDPKQDGAAVAVGGPSPLKLG